MAATSAHACTELTAGQLERLNESITDWSSPMTSSGIIPIGFTYEREPDEQRIRPATHVDALSPGMENQKISVELVVDDHVETHEFVVLEYMISRRPVTKPERRFANRVQRLFAEKAEGVEDDE